MLAILHLGAASESLRTVSRCLFFPQRRSPPLPTWVPWGADLKGGVLESPEDIQCPGVRFKHLENILYIKQMLFPVLVPPVARFPRLNGKADAASTFLGLPVVSFDVVVPPHPSHPFHGCGWIAEDTPQSGGSPV